MSTDDDVSSLVAKKLLKIEAKEHKAETGESDERERTFGEIGVEDGCIAIDNHIEHNGYYGGFGLTITEQEAM